MPFRKKSTFLEKILLIFVVFLGGGSLIFAFLRMQHNFKAPFLGAKKTTLTSQAPGKDLLALRDQDTDEDGLSDFEETYLYTTSSYLPDTDSDGYSDKEEVESGNDPLCPFGLDCSSPRLPEKETKPEELLGEAPEVSIDLLRQALLSSGAPQEVIDQIDDETLKKLYQDTLQEQTLNQENVASDEIEASEERGSSFLEGLQDLKAPEIRELLRKSGADEKTLNEIDDASLKAMFKETLKEQMGHSSE